MSEKHVLARIEDFAVGQRAAFTKTVSEADIALFVGVTGDVNPLHVDAEFARATFFGSRIGHGLLAGSLISTVVGTRLPGTGAIYRAQSFEFRRPTRIGDTLTAWVEVVAIDRDEEILELSTGVDNQRGERIIDGRARVGLIRSGRSVDLA
ncbi:MAG: MaoC family dehydratase [Thermoanaerobaculia bacterium]|nr:MaoC family dehydratase [Thermoanaerobaculia bacterium]